MNEVQLKKQHGLFLYVLKNKAIVLNNQKGMARESVSYGVLIDSQYF